MEQHHCHMVNRDTVKFMPLNSEESLTASDYFCTNYWKKIMAVDHNEIKAVFPSWKMNCDRIFFVEGTTTI